MEKNNWLEQISPWRDKIFFFSFVASFDQGANI